MSNWKGGRRPAHNGYVLLWAPQHHLANGNGYALEHRVVAEMALGRRLQPGEIVHHINEIKTDNRPENLEVLSSRAAHAARHRTRTDLRDPGEPDVEVACSCGCGTMLQKYDRQGRPRRFAHGHNRRAAA